MTLVTNPLEIFSMSEKWTIPTSKSRKVLHWLLPFGDFYTFIFSELKLNLLAEKCALMTPCASLNFANCSHYLKPVYILNCLSMCLGKALQSHRTNFLAPIKQNSLKCVIICEDSIWSCASDSPIEPSNSDKLLDLSFNYQVWFFDLNNGNVL